MKQKSAHALHFDMLPLDVPSEKVDHALHISNSISKLGKYRGMQETQTRCTKLDSLEGFSFYYYQSIRSPNFICNLMFNQKYIFSFYI